MWSHYYNQWTCSLACLFTELQPDVFSDLQDQLETSDSSICIHLWIKRPRLSSATSSGWRAWVSYKYRKRHTQNGLDPTVLNLWLLFLTQNSSKWSIKWTAQFQITNNSEKKSLNKKRKPKTFCSSRNHQTIDSKMFFSVSVKQKTKICPQSIFQSDHPLSKLHLSCFSISTGVL